MHNTTMMILIAMMAGGIPGFSADAPGQKPGKVEVRHSMVGYRDTLLFYSFPEQRVVLVLEFNSKEETLPVTGTAHLFDEATTEQGLKKWINNRHSDGLFADAPTPFLSRNLPAGFCAVTSRTQTGTSENPGPGKEKFKDFEVGFSVQAQTLDDNLTLPAFSDTTRVHIEIE